MKISKNLSLIVISLLLVVGVTACEDKGPAEKAGEKIDKAIEKTGDKLEKAGDKIEKASDDVVEALTDTKITTQVKAAIFNMDTLKSLQISVDTIDGVVTLSGTVDSEEQRDLAETTATAVTGVNSVRNDLEVNANE